VTELAIQLAKRSDYGIWHARFEGINQTICGHPIDKWGSETGELTRSMFEPADWAQAAALSRDEVCQQCIMFVRERRVPRGRVNGFGSTHQFAGEEF
jgi:hypothetical protein